MRKLPTFFLLHAHCWRELSQLEKEKGRLVRRRLSVRLISSLSIPRLNLRAGKARPDAANDSAYQGTWSLILDDSRYD